MKLLAERAMPLYHEDFEVCHTRQASLVLQGLVKHGLIAVINCAARHDVDAIERDSAETKKAFEVNAIGAKNLAIACRDCGLKLVRISTDYVFSGEKGPYRESDRPAPVNIYGVTKLAGEQIVQLACENHLIIRTSHLFGIAGCRAKSGGNFVETIIRLSERGKPIDMVADLTTSPTYTKDLAGAIVSLLDQDERGIYHVANSGACTIYEFAEAILRLSHLELEMRQVKSEERDFARKPLNSALLCTKLEDAGLGLRAWPEALAAYLKETGRIDGGH